ncbi:hypothetical protein DFH06DRAFT_1378234 [Mycena polygramma]|nr:hypothetical protein DFH06DRAFT_1378234 [Mycena polygramma]
MPLARLDLLANAWHCDDSTDLGRAIAAYLSEDRDSQTDSSDATDSEDDELPRLRRENLELRGYIHGIETELDHLRALVKDLNIDRNVFVQPPPEILRTIFDFVIPPSFLLDPRISYGPESPWCQSIRAKITLLNVCWAWYHAGIDMLYENIAFRNVCQVSILLRTLRNQTSVDFGRMITEIGIHCFTPDGYSAVFQTDLNAVISHAPRLSSLLLHPASSPPLPVVFKAIPSPITNLDCGPTVNYYDLHEHLGHLSSSLLSLSIHLFTAPPNLPSFPIHTFPRLETLRCSVGAASALTVVAEWLILPSLKSFIFQYMLKEPSELKACLAFCKIRGQRLRTLSFWSSGAIHSTKYYASSSSTSDIQSILQICPRLEHLVLPGPLAHSPELSHRTVKWVDFWTMHGDSTSLFLETVTLPNFPALRGIRQVIISAPLLFGHIPTVIPPQLNLEEPFEFSYPGFFLRHGSNRIYRNDVVDSLGAEYDDEDESDGDYTDSGPSSDGTSDDDTTSDPESEETYSSGWEADHESTIALYDQLLN